LPRDLHNLNEALAEIDKIAMHTTQGSFVKVSDVRRLLHEQHEIHEKELEDRIEKRIPYRMSPERARRLAMRDEELRETHRPTGPREAGKSVPAGPPASEGVKP
jgi:hypothetical protein